MTRKTTQRKPSAAGRKAARRDGELVDLFRTMVLIRKVEEQLSALFEAGEIPGFIHLSIGQEAVAAGVCTQLSDKDTVASNHRGHGHALAKGIDLDLFFSEIMGRADGICKGRGGSMHIADSKVGMLGANGIVGAGLPIAVGSALAHQIRRSGGVAVAFFGDGALAEGAIHESFNLAALWRLPLLAVCENNGWGEFTPTDGQLAGTLSDLSAAYGLPYRSVDGNDVAAVAAMAAEALDIVRAGNGPVVLECRTTRVHGHFEGDPQRYRSGDELGSLSRFDPIERARGILMGQGQKQADVARIAAEADERVRAAVERARSAPLPDFAEAMADVYA